MSNIERLAPMSSDTSKNRIITITGLSGSGKDYLVSAAQKICPDLIGQQISIFNFGSELLKSLAAQAPDMPVHNRDMLKQLQQEAIDPAVQLTLQRLLMNQPALYLTHVVHRQRDKLVISPDNERLVNSMEYVFVHTEPGQIFDWRQQEMAKRQRQQESLDEIAMHQNIAQAATHALALSLDTGYMIIRNEPSYTAEAASALAEESARLCQNVFRRFV